MLTVLQNCAYYDNTCKEAQLKQTITNFIKKFFGESFASKKAASFEAASESQSDDKSPNLTRTNIIAKSLELSRDGPEGNRTPETQVSSLDSSPDQAHQEASYQKQTIGESKVAESCPYCASKNFVKRGLRKKKLESVQLYLCRNAECGRTFTAQFIKGKHFPLNVIIEAMSYYNLGLTLEDTCRIIQQKFGAAPETATLSSWLEQYKILCRYERLRPWALKMYKPQDMVEVVTMAQGN